MLLELFFICHLAALTVANPFHKYPFVFLLDVGNEELDKTNTEQIRVSIPGGSLALRYPAIGDGNTIAHVRVSGIDFGTDLKANIIDGGPGYKYVVLVFMGNPGLPYDAVVTVDTLSSDKNVDYNVQDTGEVDVNEENDNSNEMSEDNDTNDSSEEMDDDTETSNSVNVNSEVVQSSSNVYNYAQNEVMDNDDDSQEEEETKDIHNQYRENVDQSYSNHKGEFKDYVDDEDDQDDEQVQSGDPKAEKYSVNNGYVLDDYYDNEEPVRIVDSNLYNKYKALKPHLYDSPNVYPQEAVHEIEEQNARLNSGPEDPTEMDQMFNDEEVHNDSEKYKDSNNNYFDSDDSSAVAY